MSLCSVPSSRETNRPPKTPGYLACAEKEGLAGWQGEVRKTSPHAPRLGSEPRAWGLKPRANCYTTAIPLSCAQTHLPFSPACVPGPRALTRAWDALLLPAPHSVLRPWLNCHFWGGGVGVVSHFPSKVLGKSSAAATVKSLQSCPTLCDPINGSPPGSTIPGILQARILE